MNDNIKKVNVSQLTNQIKNELESKFVDILVEGEISNWKSHSSGHKYFTLKDEGASIGCVHWKYRQRLNFIPNDGMKVIVKGSVTLYPPQGKYQIDVESITPAGQGNLYIAFEALKKKLSEKLYFDQLFKKPIPSFPQKIGIATSPTGAAIQDISSTIERRYKQAEIYFRPTLVQGDGAAEDIVRAIIELNDCKVDVIIIGRGGGSLEDLWCFNEEITADAIFNSSIPIISAVGHETDFTISDFTADLRAATPTAAAEIVTPLTSDFLVDFIENSKKSIIKNISREIDNLKYELEKSFSLKNIRRVQEKINLYSQRRDDLNSSLIKSINYVLEKSKSSVNLFDIVLKANNPILPLEKGYALLKINGKTINPNKTLLNMKKIEIVRKNETIFAQILGAKTESLF